MSLKLVVVDSSQQSRVSGKGLEALDALGPWAQLTDSAFVIHTSLSTAQVLTRLLGDGNLDDNLYVLELTTTWSGYGMAQVNDFLQQHA